MAIESFEHQFNEEGGLIAPAIKYLSFVIPAKAGHEVKLLRYPAIPLDAGTSPA